MSFAPLSFKAGAVISAYRIVKMDSTANTVVVGAASTDKLLGVTQDDVIATGDAIPVITGGLAKVIFNDSCAVGGWVTTNTLGAGIPAVATTAGIYVIGQLVGPAIQATGAVGEVNIQPFQFQIP